MSRATSPVDLKPVLHVDIMMDDWLDTLVNPPEQPSITGSASVAQSPSDLNDHDIRNRPSTSKRAIEADLEDATKTTARGPQKRQKTKMKPDAVIADLLMRIENLKGTTVIKRVQTDTVSSVDVNCPKPSLHTATVVNQRRTKTEIDKDEQRDEGNVADELRDLRHEHQQDMKEIRSDIQRNNAELRAAMAANETAQTNRYHELMGNFQQLMEQFETIKEQNSKTARITKEIQLTLLTSSLEGGSCDITEDQNFVAPKWPLSTAEQVLELNTKLQALEYRDQVFIRMKKWRLAVTGDVRTTVLRFMLKMIDLETYYLFSWSGKSTIDSEVISKLVFKDLKEIHKLLSAMVGNVPFAYITDEIKYFMKRVPQRIHKLRTTKGLP